jgi:DNA-directed RNA polymerase subunit RPC12/RpoP
MSAGGTDEEVSLPFVYRSDSSDDATLKTGDGEHDEFVFEVTEQGVSADPASAGRVEIPHTDIDSVAVTADTDLEIAGEDDLLAWAVYLLGVGGVILLLLDGVVGLFWSGLILLAATVFGFPWVIWRVWELFGREVKGFGSTDVEQTVNARQWLVETGNRMPDGTVRKTNPSAEPHQWFDLYVEFPPDTVPDLDAVYQAVPVNYWTPGYAQQWPDGPSYPMMVEIKDDGEVVATRFVDARGNEISRDRWMQQYGGPGGDGFQGNSYECENCGERLWDFWDMNQAGNDVSCSNCGHTLNNQQAARALSMLDERDYE